MPLLCPLPHRATGLPEGWSYVRLSDYLRLSQLRYGRLSGPQRRVLDDLSAEATRAGVCPNHVYILREFVARTFVPGRPNA